MRLFIIICLSGMIAFSCKQKTGDLKTEGISTAANLQHVEDEIMKIHDEVMPKMSDINRLSSQLREIKKNAGVTTEGQPVAVEGLDDTLKSLREAEQGMSDWMKNYSDIKPNVTDENLKEFYEKELEKIKAVRDNMLNSIEKANQWLLTHPAG